MKGITKASIETSVLPGAQGICSLCTTQERHTIATMRCQDCGPLAFFCDKCFEVCHMQGQLHFSERWNVSQQRTSFIKFLIWIGLDIASVYVS